MNPQRFVSSFEKFERATREESRGGEMRFACDGVLITLNALGAEAFREIGAAALVAPSVQATMTEDAVLQRLRRVIVRAFKCGTYDPKRMANELASELDVEFEDVAVAVPISGLRLSEDFEFEIGDVTVVHAKHAHERFRKALSAHEEAAPESEQTVKVLAAKFEATFSRSAAVFARVRADPSRAAELVSECTDEAIDLLRFVVPIHQPSNFNVQLGLTGEFPTGTRATLVTKANGGWSMNRTQVGPLAPFELNEASAKTFSELGLGNLAKYVRLSPTNRSKYVVQLFRALHWFGRSESAVGTAWQLLGLVTALEVLFNPQNERPLAMAVAEGTAYVLSENKDARKEIVDRVKRAYGSRSKVSHGGTDSSVRESQDWLRGTVHQVLQWAIKQADEFDSLDDLNRWLNDRRYA